MNDRVYAFRPPLWRTVEQLNLRTAAISLGSLLWLALYVWIGLRLVHRGLAGFTTSDLLAIVLCIFSGVLLAIGWRMLYPRWRWRWLRGRRAIYRRALSLVELQALSPSEFEEYVAQRLFARHGYQVHNMPDVKDGGIDVVVTDRHGRKAVVQCKRYTGTVGEPAIRDLYGTMIHSDAQQAYLVTTGRFSTAAREWVADKPIDLIDGERLVRLSRTEPQPIPSIEARTEGD